MISASHRLPLRSLPGFFDTSHKVNNSTHIAFIRQNSVQRLRCAVVVPKKAEKLSTRRNALKRQIYSIIETSGNLDKSIDLVVVARRKMSINDTKSFFSDLQAVLHHGN